MYFRRALQGGQLSSLVMMECIPESDRLQSQLHRQPTAAMCTGGEWSTGFVEWTTCFSFFALLVGPLFFLNAFEILQY